MHVLHTYIFHKLFRPLFQKSQIHQQNLPPIQKADVVQIDPKVCKAKNMN